jgi:hypothetical protein
MDSLNTKVSGFLIHLIQSFTKTLFFWDVALHQWRSLFFWDVVLHHWRFLFFWDVALNQWRYLFFWDVALHHWRSVFLGCDRASPEVSVFLGCGPALLDNWCLVFSDNIAVSSSRFFFNISILED